MSCLPQPWKQTTPVSVLVFATDDMTCRMAKFGMTSLYVFGFSSASTNCAISNTPVSTFTYILEEKPLRTVPTDLEYQSIITRVS